LFKKVKKEKFEDYDPEIIAWQREDKGELNTPLMFSFPKPRDNIKDKKYFAVKSYEKVLFYDKGSLVDIIGGGIYELAKNARIKGTEIVWIDITFIEIPWGIPKSEGIPTKDGFTVGLHGDLKLRIGDVKTFYNDIVAGKKEWTVLDLKNWIKSLLHTSLRDIFKKYNAKQIILEERERVINLVISKVTEEFLRYGLELETFNVIGIKYPEELQPILDQDREKTKTIAKLGKEGLDDLLKQKNDLQARIKELNEKLKKQQDLLLNGEINQDEYEKKKYQIQIFIDETKKELDKINEILSHL